MQAIGRDVLNAWRHFRNSPGFAVVAIASLAIAIGANSTVFSLINAVVLRPLPVERPEQLFLASTPLQFGSDFSYPMVQRARELLAGRGEICGESSQRAVQLTPAAATGGARNAGDAIAVPDSAQIRLVTGDCFRVLRQRPAAGRLLGPADDRDLSGTPVAVISDRFWARAFGRAASAVGSSLIVNGVPLTIVGVTRPEFFGTTVAVTTPDLWVPATMQATLRFAGNGSNHNGDWDRPYVRQREIYWLSVIVRVEGSAASAAAALTAALERELPEGSGVRTAEGRVPPVSLQPGWRGTSPFRDRVETTLFVLMGMVALLLLLAAVNIAGVLLARGTARRRELAVRMSIGASRAAVMRQMLLESTVLALGGGALGLVLTSPASVALVTLINRGAALTTVDVSPDWRVAMATLGAAIIAGVVAGGTAAWRCTAISGTAVLTAHASTVSSDYSIRRFSPGALLVAAQMALSVMLLILAGLCVRTLQAMANIDLGFDPEGVVVARIDPRSAGYQPKDLPALYERVLADVRAIPGVTSASLSGNGPFGGTVNSGTLDVEGFTPANGERVRGTHERVTLDYVDTLRLRIVRGRNFTARDAVPGRRVSIITETFARRYFGGDAIGKRWGYGQRFAEEGYEVVGVIADAKYNDLRGAATNMVYVLAASEQNQPFFSSVEVRVSGATGPLAPAIRNALRNAANGVPVRTIEPLRARVSAMAAGERLLAWLATVLGAMAALLACLGLYGMTSYGVSRRTVEIGVRMALGAERHDVRRLVLREALVLVVAGVAAGVPLAITASGSMRRLLYGVTPTDMATYIAAIVVLTTVAVVAAYLPARRASRLEPVAALRET